MDGFIKWVVDHAAALVIGLLTGGTVGATADNIINLEPVQVTCLCESQDSAVVALDEQVVDLATRVDGVSEQLTTVIEVVGARDPEGHHR